MQPGDLVHRRPLLVSAAVGLMAGVVLGLAWPVVVPPADPQQMQGWAPPRGLDGLRSQDKEFAAARDAPIWGGGGSLPGVKRTVWRLTGIISDPFPAALVLSGTSKDAQRIRVGGALPDGGVIKQIATSGVVYTLEGCAYGRDLYAPAQSAVQGSCGAGTAAEN